MAHFTRIRETGMWTVGVLLPSELEAMDAAQFAALNGDAGGTWSPSAQIQIYGSYGLGVETFYAQNTTLGMSGTDSLTIYAGVYQTGDEAHNGTETHNGNCTFTRNVTLGNNSTSDVVTVQAQQYYSGTELHNGAETHGGAEEHGGAVTNNGSVTNNGAVTNESTVVNNGGTTQNGNFALKGVLSEFAGVGLILPATTFINDASATIATRSYSRFFYSTITAARTFNLNYAGTYAGETVEIINTNTGYAVLVSAYGYGAPLGSVGGAVDAASKLQLIWTGTMWRPVFLH